MSRLIFVTFYKNPGSAGRLQNLFYTHTVLTGADPELLLYFCLSSQAEAAVQLENFTCNI